MDSVFEQQIVGGLPIELMDRLKRRRAVVEHRASSSHHYVFSPSGMILALGCTVGEAEDHIRPFLHTQFATAITDGEGRVEAVIIEDKRGRRAIRARTFVDASGDADLVHRMGLPTYKRAHLQPPTVCAVLHGLDKIAQGTPDFDLRCEAFNAKYAAALRPGFLWNAQLPGTDRTMVTGTRVHGADCSDADQLTQAELEGRRQVRAILDILHAHVPGGEQVTLQGLPSRIGVRETRRARCRHRLTEREVLMGEQFPDAIANGSYRVDVHIGYQGWMSMECDIKGDPVTALPVTVRFLRERMRDAVE